MQEALDKLTKRTENMATKDEVKAAISEERAEVNARLAEQDAKILDLETKLAAGGTVTTADLEEIREAVRAIYTSPEPKPTPIGPINT